MQNTQEFLNTLTIAVVLVIATLIMLDFFAGLVNLWTQLNKQEIHTINSLPHKPKQSKASTFPCLKRTSKFVQIIPETDYIASEPANSVDTKSLTLMIQNLPQSRIRTAARRLGIRDRIDGKYQRLAVLRMQIQNKLKTQPQQVTRILNEIANTSKSKVAAN